MAFTRAFKGYLREITATYQRGDAREESFYDPLAELIRTAASLCGRQGTAVTTLPRPTEAGNPDFRVSNGRDRIVGYIETKHLDVQNLDQVAPNLRRREMEPPLARFEREGGNSVARTRRGGFQYDPSTERLYINTAQHLAPVPLEVWEYQLGGYHVADKWFTDRADRPLSLDEIRTYCRIVTALDRTIAIQDEIDDLYRAVEGRVVALGI